jgi:hypothetical protein
MPRPLVSAHAIEPVLTLLISHRVEFAVPFGEDARCVGGVVRAGPSPTSINVRCALLGRHGIDSSAPSLLDNLSHRCIAPATICVDPCAVCRVRFKAPVFPFLPDFFSSREMGGECWIDGCSGTFSLVELAVEIGINRDQTVIMSPIFLAPVLDEARGRASRAILLRLKKPAAVLACAAESAFIARRYATIQQLLLMRALFVATFAPTRVPVAAFSAEFCVADDADHGQLAECLAGQIPR